jgi:hypothetical protein
LKPAKPKRELFSAASGGHVLTLASKLFARALGLKAMLPLLGALYLR